MGHTKDAIVRSKGPLVTWVKCHIWPRVKPTLKWRVKSWARVLGLGFCPTQWISVYFAGEPCCFCRSDERRSKGDFSGRWSGPTCRWCSAKYLVGGHSDATFFFNLLCEGYLLFFFSFFKKKIKKFRYEIYELL
jgi:hypothetical protein